MQTRPANRQRALPTRMMAAAVAALARPAARKREADRHPGLDPGPAFSSKLWPGKRVPDQVRDDEPFGAYLILASLNSTCLRARGSYFLKLSFSVCVRGFFFVT